MTYEELLQLDWTGWHLAVFAFLRVATILTWLPIFGDLVIPMRVKILFSVVFTFALWPIIGRTIAATTGSMQWDVVTLTITSVREAIFGLSIGFSARVLIYAVQMGAEFAGINMGFQAASMFSNSAPETESGFARLQLWVVLLVMFALNIHHVFIEQIVLSFEKVPIAPVLSPQILLSAITTIATTALSLALRVAAPLLVVQFLTSLALIGVARSVPQVNVFLLNFPLSFILGMVVLFFGASTFVFFIARGGMHIELESFAGFMRSYSTQGASPQ